MKVSPVALRMSSFVRPSCQFTQDEPEFGVDGAEPRVADSNSEHSWTALPLPSGATSSFGSVPD